MKENNWFESIGGGLVSSKLIDYVVPFSWTPQGKLFKAQKSFQERMKAKEDELRIYLQKEQIVASKAIALFQAKAMRQLQIELAQKHAQNMLHDHLLQNALQTFPLNVSPLVLLKNQSQSLGHLLAFSDTDVDASNISIEDVYEEVMDVYKEKEKRVKQLDALNIFVAPVHIDSKIKNRKVLSDQIWDTIYQRLESFFTREYNRSSDHPVIFYPTAWNDKYNPGMHAAETLHFFLKDLPCVVIEPRFDGTSFRMMFSAWGLGYNSTIHHRTEMSFQINIDAVLACSAYERSRKALDAIKEIEKTLDSQKLGFGPTATMLQRNIDLFQALHIEERMKEKRMEEIDALGIYNIFKIEPVQDIKELADILSVHIGLNLAVLADIHHLRSYDREPILPKLLKPNFPNMYEDKLLREQLFKEYEASYKWLQNEVKESNEMRAIRGNQIDNVKKLLNLSDSSEMLNSLTIRTCEYVRKNFQVEAETITDAVNLSIEFWESKHVDFFKDLLNYDEVANNIKLHQRIDTRIYDLQQQMK